MTWDQAVNAIRQRYVALVAGPLSLLTTYDNAPFTQPAGQPWCRFSILLGDSQQTTTGGGSSGNVHRTVGVAVAQIFVPAESGDALAYRLAESVAVPFRSKTAEGVTYKSPSVRSLGRDGAWWQINVSCPFDFERIA